MAQSRLGLAVASLLLVAGCKGQADTSPEEAFVRLLDACDSGDGAKLFDAFDTNTQWAIETVHKADREMRQLVIDTYPPETRDAALARLPAACEEDLERPRRFFRRLDASAEILADLKRRIYAGTGQPVGSVRKKEGIAEVWREGGSIFHFARDDKGRWGFNEQREMWEREKERALHEVDTVRRNADLYRKAKGGAPAGKGT